MTPPHKQNSAEFREHQTDQIFEQAHGYLGEGSYLAQLVESHRAGIINTDPTALLRLQAILQGIWHAGGLEQGQFQDLITMIFTGQADGWLS